MPSGPGLVTGGGMHAASEPGPVPLITKARESAGFAVDGSAHDAML